MSDSSYVVARVEEVDNRGDEAVYENDLICGLDQRVGTVKLISIDNGYNDSRIKKHSNRHLDLNHNIMSGLVQKLFFMRKICDSISKNHIHNIDKGNSHKLQQHYLRII